MIQLRSNTLGRGSVVNNEVIANSGGKEASGRCDFQELDDSARRMQEVRAGNARSAVHVGDNSLTHGQ